MITVPGPAQPAAAGDPAAAAPAIHVAGLRKRYGDVIALAAVDLDVRAGEFFTLLGPSGSGKTTLLRLIAGFERPDGGRIELGGSDVTRVPPYARNVNTVFQDYALFPHMTVAQNIEYGLRVRHVPKAERREKAGRALEMVRLPGLGGRKPAQLSGGQRQRVALARAIVNEPQVLLLDEPLGALDLKLRQAMQIELKRIQRETGTTTIAVTHDQAEALSMSDLVAIMNGGRIEQVGSPEEVYRRPATRFVAEFLGEANLLEVRSGRVEAFGLPVQGAAEGTTIIRPEDLVLTDAATATVKATVTGVVYQGSRLRLSATADGCTRPLVVTAVPGELPETPAAGDQIGLRHRGGELRTLQAV
jgi:putative spermidine/putrescine transport system ATP-binding protein